MFTLSKINALISCCIGTEKYDISLSNNEHSDLRVADLACEVEKVTGVPLHNQKLIYRGLYSDSIFTYSLVVLLINIIHLIVCLR